MGGGGGSKDPKMVVQNHGCCGRRSFCFRHTAGGNHPKERFLDQAQARASYTPIFFGGGHSRSIPDLVFDVQPLVQSFCPIKQSPIGFFDSEASIP